MKLSSYSKKQDIESQPEKNGLLCQWSGCSRNGVISPHRGQGAKFYCRTHFEELTGLPMTEPKYRNPTLVMLETAGKDLPYELVKDEGK